MKNKKGFIFVETILVTAILLASLMLVYSLFVSSNNSETRRLRYDDAAKLYQTFYIKKYLESFELDKLKTRITDDNPYHMIYSSQSELFASAYNNERSFFEDLWVKLNIKTIALTQYDVSNIISCDTASTLALCSNEPLISYLKTLDNETSTGYRLVIEYQTNLSGEACSSNSDCFAYFANVRVGS